MRAQGSGSVINISSMFSLVASAPVPEAGYVASKSAVNGLTRELASQWARGRDSRQRDRARLVPERDERGAVRGRAHPTVAREAVPDGTPGRIDELDGVLLFLATRRVLVLHGPGDRDRRRLDDPVSVERAAAAAGRRARHRRPGGDGVADASTCPRPSRRSASRGSARVSRTSPSASRTRSGRAIVVRRPPLGAILASAHDMGREYRILSGLGTAGARVPRTLALLRGRRRDRGAVLRDGARRRCSS